MVDVLGQIRQTDGIIVSAPAKLNGPTKQKIVATVGRAHTSKNEGMDLSKIIAMKKGEETKNRPVTHSVTVKPSVDESKAPNHDSSDAPKLVKRFSNFKVHGKEFLFAPSSCGFDESSRFRQLVIWVATHPQFEHFILMMIIANSIILAIQDYSVVDPVTLEPKVDGSWRNMIVESSEPVFTWVFFIECVLKVIAMGFISGPGSYLRNGWNWLDFIVVCAGVLTLFDFPNVSAFRAIRVLRPLKSLTIVPGMKVLIVSLLSAIPQLLNVVALLMFMFFMFGILGLQVWAGIQHNRCRLTPFPIILPPDGILPLSQDIGEPFLQRALLHPELYRCNMTIGKSSVLSPIPVHDDNWATMTESPWSTPRSCFWPSDPEDEKVCSSNGAGDYTCPLNLTCGSVYDYFGNSRFDNANAMREADFVPGRNFGYTNFDNFISAFITIFQCITMEGWVDIMYQLMDGHNSTFAAIYFTFLILFGSFFLLNLTLAVLWEQFDRTQAEEIERKKLERAAAAKLENEATGRKTRRRSVTAQVTESLRRLSISSMTTNTKRWVCVRTCLKCYDYTWPGNGKKSPFCVIRTFYKVATNAIFQMIIVVMIIVNTIVLSLDRFPVDAGEEDKLEWINFSLSMIFALEMLIKLLGLGIKEYVKDFFNVFDAFIVVSGFFEIVYAPPWEGEDSGSAVSALRSFRLFRVFKLARSWVSLRKLLQTIARTLIDIANFTVVLFLFIYIFALVGMQSFANKFRFDPITNEPLTMLDARYEDAEVPRANFDTFIWSIATVFQVLTGENWNTVMYDGIRVAGASGAIYFIALVVLGNFIVLNLFLAILLGNFEGNGLQDNEEDELVRLGIKVKERKVGCIERNLTRMKEVCINACKKRNLKVEPEPVTSVKSEFKVKPKAMNKWRKLRMLRKFDARLKLCRSIALKAKPNFHITLMSGKVVTIRVNVSDTGATIRRIKGKIESATNIPPNVQSLYLANSFKELKDDEHPLELGLQDGANLRMVSLYSKSLFCFPASSAIRIKLASFVRSSLFDNSVLVLIIISSITLAIDTPLLQGGDVLADVLDGLDWVLTIAFCVEMMLKIVASGFILHRGSYLRNSWNVLDFVIVIISVLSRSGRAEQYSWLKSLRTFRALRPLRMISRAPGMKLVVQALLAALPEMVNVVLVCILIFLIFAIIGVNNFKGTFYACQGDVFSGFNATQIHLIQYPELLQELTSTQRAWIDPVLLNDPKWNSSASVPPSSRMYCESMGASWGPTIPQTFDNVGNGLLTLLEISTTEGWVDVMYSAVDAVGIDMQPIENHSVDGPVLFFLVFMLTGCFFVMNLFVGVLLDNFDRIKKELGENGLLTDAQREWVASMKVISKAMPLRKVPPPENGIRRLCFDMTQNTAFDELIMGCIGVNTITMSLTFIGAPETWDIFLKICNYVFAFIFAVEALLKLTALGFGYFYDDIQFGGIPNVKHHESDALFGVKPPMKDLKKSAAFQLEKLKKLKQKFSGSESKPMSPNHAHHQVIERRKSFSKMSHAELNAIHNDKRHHKMLLKMLKKRSDMDPTKPDIRHVYNLWNCFDFTIVVGTMVGLIFQWTTSGNAGSSVATIAMIIRTFRICRIVRLIKRAKSLRILFNTLILTLPGLANVGSLLFLFLFIYSIMGVQIFAKTKLHGMVDEHANFQNLATAFLTLVRCSTGEAWNYLMWDLSVTTDCTPDPAYDEKVCAFNNYAEGCIPIDGCGTPVAFPFFVSFTLLITFIMLNMFIGIICDGFSEISSGENTLLSMECYRTFIHKWQKYDPHATLYVRKDQLKNVLREVPLPLGFPPEVVADKRAMNEAVLGLGLPHYAGNYACYTDVATALTKNMIHREKGFQIEDLTLPDQHNQLVQFLTRFSVGHTSKMRTGFTTEHAYAGKVIMESYRVLRYRETLLAAVGRDCDGNTEDESMPLLSSASTAKDEEYRRAERSSMKKRFARNLDMTFKSTL